MIHHPKIIYSLARFRYAVAGSLRHRKISSDYVKRIKGYRDQYRQARTHQQISAILMDLKSQIGRGTRDNKATSTNFLFSLVNPKKNKLFHSPREADLACKAIALAAVAMEYAPWPSGEKIILHDNQLEAVFALADGRVIQMDTGEGKTYVGAARAFLNALWGMRTAIITPNSYLANRDAQWMAPFYRFLGMTVTCADHGINSDPYYSHVCYVSLNKLIADYFNNIQAQDAAEWKFVSLDSVIIDEVDAVLLDSGSFGIPVYLETKPETYNRAWETALHMSKDLHYKIEDAVSITEAGHQFIKDRWQTYTENREDMPVIYSWHVLCALKAKETIKRDADYIVEGNRISYIDQKTGRPTNRGFSLGIQQALEKKENLPISLETIFIYTVHPGTILNQARNLCGMSGSAISEQIAFRNLFGLPVISIPSNEESKRVVHPDEYYINKKAQFQRVCNLAREYINDGRPVLIGTQSIEQAERLGQMLESPQWKVNVITARNHFQEAAIMEMAGQPGVITIAARMAGRGVDIKIASNIQQAGGLVVISVGRFTLRRLDEQLIGRTGRQGQGGDVFFILSLEDEIFRLRFEAGLSMPKNMIKYVVDQSIEDLGGDLDAASLPPGIYKNFINQTQAEFRDLNYQNLSSQLIQDRTLDMVRSNYESLRYMLLSKDHLDQDIKSLLSQVAEFSNLDFIHELEGLADTHIYVPDNKIKDSRVFEKAREILYAEYINRRNQLGEIGLIRERVILLRSLDFQWALLYLDWQKFIEMKPVSFNSSAMESIFLIKRMRIFRQNYAEHALEYLFQIDLNDVLQLCYYWRGTVIPVGSYGKRRLGGDVDIPEESMFQSSEDARLRLRESAPDANSGVMAKLEYVEQATNPLSVTRFSTRRLRNHGGDENIFLRKISNLPLVILQTIAILIGFLTTYFVANAILTSSGLRLNEGALSIASIVSFFKQSALQLYIPLIVLVGILFLFPARRQRKVLPPGYYILVTVLFIVLTIIEILFNRLFGIDAYLLVTGYGLGLLLADALLSYGGINVNLGLLAAISLIYLNKVYQLNDFLELPQSRWAMGGILLFGTVTSLLKNKFQVIMIKDWMPISDAEDSIRHTYAINTLDSPSPLILGLIWTLLALRMVGSLSGQAHSWLDSQPLFIGLFVLVTIGFALQGAKWKLLPTLYNNVATHSKGIIAFNGHSRSSEAVIKILRWHMIFGWSLLLLFVSTLIYLRSIEPEQARLLLLVTTVGVVGITSGLCLRYLFHRFQYWVDSNDLKNSSYNETAVASLPENFQQAVRDPLHWLTWGTLVAMGCWYFWTLA